MKHIMVEMMSQLTSLSKEEEQSIEESFRLKTYPKNTCLLKEGQIATEGYFVVKGCIRSYLLRDGEERTLDFFTENQSAINFDSISNGRPSRIYCVCMEESTLAILDAEKEQELYKKHPRFETFCREGMEKMIGDQKSGMVQYVAMGPEERYLHLLKERPHLLNRVPQYQIASYLGMKPETLSRIRKRISVRG